jgi:hypothetical protein
MGYRGHVALTAKGRATRQRIIEGAAEYLRSDIPGEATLDDIRAITGTASRCFARPGARGTSRRRERASRAR